MSPTLPFPMPLAEKYRPRAIGDTLPCGEAHFRGNKFHQLRFPVFEGVVSVVGSIRFTRHGSVWRSGNALMDLCRRTFTGCFGR